MVQYDLEPVVRLGPLLNDSAFATLEKVGEDLGLPPLVWEFMPYPRRMVIEGRPSRAIDTAVCAKWASRLGMTEYPNPHGRLPKAWFLSDGAWDIDVVAEPPLSLEALAALGVRKRRPH